MKKDALILALITLVAGFLLGGVYEITKEPRAKQEEIAKNKAYIAVYENNKAYKDMDVDKFTFEDVDLNTLIDLDKALKDNNLSGKVTIDSLVKALDKKGNTVGFVFNVTSKGGYGGDISYSVGFNTTGTVTGISILSIEETPGLGMKAKEDTFLNQYVDKNGSFVVNKDNPNETDISIDSISGATITSRAMTDGVNGAVVAFSCMNVEEPSPIPEETTAETNTTSTTEETGGASNE